MTCHVKIIEGVPEEVIKLVTEAIEAAAIKVDVPKGELSVLVTDNAGITPFNEKYTGRKGETDVLAFPFDAFEHEDPYLGDIIISYERAESQADELGHGPSEEIRKLAVHGFLHLLGYDHGEGGDNTMERVEKEVAGV